MTKFDGELLILLPFLLGFIIPACCIVGMWLAKKWSKKKEVDKEELAFQRKLLIDTYKRCERIRKENPPNADFLINLTLEMYELLRS